MCVQWSGGVLRETELPTLSQSCFTLCQLVLMLIELYCFHYTLPQSKLAVLTMTGHPNVVVSRLCDHESGYAAPL